MLLVILFLSLTFISLVFLHRGFPGSIRDLGWKMSGVWSNPGKNLHVLIYNNGSLLRGHVVWSGNKVERKIVGSLVINGIEIKPFGMWSAGTFIEPITQTELPLRLRLKNKKTLAVHFLSNSREEEWGLIDPL